MFNEKPDYYKGRENKLYNSNTKKYHKVRVLNGIPYVTFNRKTRILYQGLSSNSGRINVGGKHEYFFGRETCSY